MLVPTVSAKEVTLAVIADLKPLSYQKGRIWTGKDVEIANEVFKRLNWDVNYIALPFASMLRLISRGDVDGAAGLLCSERRTERYQNIRFSKTTYHTELSIFSLKQPHPAPVFESLESFTEIPIGVTRGYTYGDAFDLHPQIDSVEVENDEDLLNLLVNKRVTFIAAEDQTLLYQARQKNIRDSIEKLYSLGFNPICMGFSKTFLAQKGIEIDAINGALDVLKIDGTIDAVLNTYSY